jgi:hypothetical protein
VFDRKPARPEPADLGTDSCAGCRLLRSGPRGSRWPSARILWRRCLLLEVGGGLRQPCQHSAFAAACCAGLPKPTSVLTALLSSSAVQLLSLSTGSHKRGAPTSATAWPPAPRWRIRHRCFLLTIKDKEIPASSMHQLLRLQRSTAHAHFACKNHAPALLPSAVGC